MELRGPHPSLKLGVLLGDSVGQNDRCYAQFDSKADMVTGMGTNSDQPFWGKIAVIRLFSHVHKSFATTQSGYHISEFDSKTKQKTFVPMQFFFLIKCGKNRHLFSYYYTMYNA